MGCTVLPPWARGNPDIPIAVGGERRVSVGVIAIKEDDAIRKPLSTDQEPDGLDVGL